MQESEINPVLKMKELFGYRQELTEMHKDTYLYSEPGQQLLRPALYSIHDLLDRVMPLGSCEPLHLEPIASELLIATGLVSEKNSKKIKERAVRRDLLGNPKHVPRNSSLFMRSQEVSGAVLIEQAHTEFLEDYTVDSNPLPIEYIQSNRYVSFRNGIWHLGTKRTSPYIHTIIRHKNGYPIHEYRHDLTDGLAFFEEMDKKSEPTQEIVGQREVAIILLNLEENCRTKAR
ncbi:hypothetical protein CO051_00635 [Candidatus Roizmanbacteria bacterium CG_4_9_14_0_2_um_filter_39_13]|uniref:Uncharacterized protein n=1 Tax=Candidatus Roizmanbacteria bacterium CG_4_9_14_0_2_um_filter_39_13 TaxID=1974839 RepID=A0A2M8F3R3_9BACT|nr:MAG: hypothetical protein COY15_03100 [Candidatus Roizmanbacteria bacterium CG_4_10_14_0_2_um_filter_39_12]PJC33944.1 MAG: hypothetical protein CO051_00635 [Candidatus Roizmanbacteria bacterium CG_4_9_14_0_2_um_filter_39_13]